jgi:DNA-binding transcriptional MerR regulator
MFSIGDISKRTGVKVPTIRYYEQLGLITPPQRSSGNQRRYSAMDLKRLAFIKHARDLGLPLDAIRELLLLSEHPGEQCADADRIAAAHLKVIRERITSLQGLERELQRIASGCSAEHVRDCYVLQSLSDHSLCNEDH